MAYTMCKHCKKPIQRIGNRWYHKDGGKRVCIMIYAEPQKPAKPKESE